MYFTTFTPMKKNDKPKLVTIKVTETAAQNFKVAAAIGKKTQYEVSEEGSHFVYGKYMSKSKK